MRAKKLHLEQFSKQQNETDIIWKRKTFCLKIIESETNLILINGI